MQQHIPCIPEIPLSVGIILFSPVSHNRRVFGSYNIEEFHGDPEPERVMLSLAKNLLMKVDTRQSIHWTIAHQLSLHNLLHVVCDF